MTSGQPIKRPRPWRTGERVSARKLDELRDGVDRLIPGTEPRQVAGDLVAQPQVFQGEIIGLAGDYISVVEYRVYSGGGIVRGLTAINVAKPWLLRRTPFDGQSRDGVSYTYTDDQTRTATAGPDVRVEHVTPGYLIGDIVYCLRTVLNATGVEVGGLMLSTLETAGGRMWAADPPS